MTLVRLGAVLIVLLGGTACARQSPPGEPTGSVPEVTSTNLPRPPATSGLPPAMRPNVAQPDPRVVELRAVRWTGVESAGGNLIRVRYTASGRPVCSALGRVDVNETAGSVTVTVYLGRQPDADCTGVQPMIAAPMTTTVTLSRPLGSRKVVDGATG